MTLPAQPMPYQKTGVIHMETTFNGRVLLADDMGLGKTLQALWFLKRERIPTMPAVVVCPAAVKYNWEHEARVHVGLRAEVLEGQAPPPTSRIIQPPSLTIINYDILPYWLPYLKRLNPTTIFIDECQYIQNRGTKRTAAVRELCRGVPNVVAMSGTPLTNRPAELWPTLNILLPDEWPSFFSYAQEYCRPRKAPWGWEFKGAENLPQLHTRLREKVMIRRLKSDVMQDLPEKFRRVVPMPLSDPEEYKYANEHFRDWLKQRQGARFSRATKAEQLSKLGYLLRLCAKLKLRSVVAWANRFLEETDEKLILFGVHQKMVEALHRRVDGKSVIINGSVTGKDREAAVQQFRTDPRCRTLVANITSAGTGVNGLQDVCSTMAFVELWWRPGDLVQAEDRLHRIGQHSVSWINYLVAHGTIEERLCEIVQAKQQVFRATLDGGVAPQDDLDVLEQLVTAMETST